MATATNIQELRQPKPLADMKPKEQIKYLLESRKAEIAAMLPKHLTAERLMKVAQIAATTTPALLECDIPSLVSAIGQCAMMGLEPNTVLGHAYLLPFNTKRKDSKGNERWVKSVQVIVGYKGLIDLARRSGQIVSIAAHEVREKDQFDCVYGLQEKLEHRPHMDGDRGQIVCFYAVAHLKDGGHAFEVMSVAQINAIRDAAEAKNKRKSAVWSDHYVEMGRKTVIRRLAKYLPLSIEMQTAVALDEAATAGRDQRLDDSTIDGVFTQVETDAPDFDAGDDAPPAGLEDNPSEHAPSMHSTASSSTMPTEEEKALWAAQEAEAEGADMPREEPRTRRAGRTTME